MEERVKLKIEIIKLLKSDKELIENHMEIIESLNGYSEYTKELKEKIFELNKDTGDDKWILIGRFIFLLDSDKSYKKISFYKENLKDYFLIRTEKEKEKFLKKEFDCIDEKKSQKIDEEYLEKMKRIKELVSKSELKSKLKGNMSEEYSKKDCFLETMVEDLRQYKENFKKGYEVLEQLKKKGVAINEIDSIFNLNKDDRSILKKRYGLYEKFKTKEKAIQKLPIAKLKSITKKGVTESEQKKALDEVE